MPANGVGHGQSIEQVISIRTTSHDVSTGEATRAIRRLQRMLPWAAATALLVIAAAMRLYQLGIGGVYDEGVYWQTLRSMSAGQALYRDIFYAQPPLFMLATFPGYALFGTSLWSARLAVAFISFAGLIGAFLLGRALGGRLGGIAALLLLVFDPMYLLLSQRLEAEVLSAAFSVATAGLAYLWWEHPDGNRGICYAALTGSTLALSVLCKLTCISVALPIFLLILARIRQIWHRGPGTRSAALLPVVSGIAASVATLAAVLLPFAGSYQPMFQSVIAFHLDAAQLYAGKHVNLSIIQAGVNPLLAATALYGTAAAVWRRDWRVVPLLVWQLATFYLLWRHAPLSRHHLLALTPPLLALATLGVSDPVPYAGKGFDALMRKATIYVTAIAILLVLATAIFDLQQDSAQYRTAKTRDLSESTQLAFRMADDLQHSTSPGQLVVTDEQLIAGFADRSTPPELVDTSAKRINSDYLTLSQLESAAAGPDVHAVLFFSERFYLPNVAAFHAWVAERFRLLHDYGRGRELWIH